MAHTQAPPMGPGGAVLAFDVGGTDIKAAIIDKLGVIRALTRTPTPGADDRAAATLAAIDAIAMALRAEHPDILPEAVGLAVPGTVDEDAGIGVYSENLGWTNVPFRDRAQELLHLPVAFAHDVRSAGEAERRLGAAAPFRNVVVMTIGTGIAGAIFLDDHPYTAGGFAGEMGHSRVADGPLCTCGGTGCLEAVASAGAIARRYTALTGNAVTGARDVLHRAANGDPDAAAIWESALDALALDLSHTVALLAPEAIVIGGGLAQAGADLFDPLRERLDGILSFHRRPILLPATVGENAGVIGVALLARDLVASAGASA
jgi:glucokinase